jgi:hypothetical protein
MFRGGFISVIYLVVGVVLAASHHYLSHLKAVRPVASAVLAVALWPLMLLSVNLHLH